MIDKIEKDISDKALPIPFWQRRWVKNTLTGLLFIAIFLLVRPFMQGDVIEGKAPMMQVDSITQQAIDLQAINREGRAVLVHFWATWCPICEVSISGIESIAQDYPVINIATQSGTHHNLLNYAHKHNMNPDLIVNDANGEWMRLFGAKAVPADFIVAPNGEITFIEVGLTTSWGLRFRLWLSELLHYSDEN